MLSRMTLLLVGLAISSLASAQQAIPLWPEGHPANEGTGPAHEEVRPQRFTIHHHPELVAYLPEKPNGSAVMICPGGGYRYLALGHEGTTVSEWLNHRGITAIVLKYRCGGGKNGHPAPLDDALRGMRLIRSRAEEWNIASDRVGVMGFSAGGHLASCTSTLSDDGNSDSDDPIEKQSSRPNFSVLVYPVVLMDKSIARSGSRRNLLGKSPTDSLALRLSTDKQVTSDAPPTFIAHASDDKSVGPANSLRYYEALLAHQVSAELHLYERGGHGFGMKTLDSKANRWLDDLDAWLAPRVVPPHDPDAPNPID